jgi:glycine oxidase
VLVAGGGVIGLSVAWRAAQDGALVSLLERDGLGHGASRVAAGMLAPVAEVEFGAAGRRVLHLGLRSAAMWPGFATELGDASGADVGLQQTGTMLLARDADEARELERQRAFREQLGLAVRPLRGSQARELEPALAPGVRMALEAPEDHSVDPRVVLAALEQACRAAGVQVREHCAVAALARDASGAVTGVRLADGDTVAAGEVVVAAGAWSGGVAGVPGDERPPVRPVRGQILRLRDPQGPGLLRRVVRFEGGYLVPRGDGRYVLGATVEERGFCELPTAGGVYELLRDAHELVPGVRELELEELSVGFRPGTPDNAPAIGRGARDGLIWATGHYRNGILLAPLTAELVGDVLAGRAPAEELAGACDPGRFARAGDALAAGAAP